MFSGWFMLGQQSCLAALSEENQIPNWNLARFGQPVTWINLPLIGRLFSESSLPARAFATRPSEFEGIKATLFMIPGIFAYESRGRRANELVYNTTIAPAAIMLQGIQSLVYKILSRLIDIGLTGAGCCR